MQAIIVCNFKENKLTKLETIGENLVLGPISACFHPNLVPNNFLVGFTSTRCYILYASIMYNVRKN